jgi:hypothetical protein
VPNKKSRLDARATRTWRDGIYDQIRELMSMQGKLSIERMCQLACVGRAGFYRSLSRFWGNAEFEGLKKALG